MLPLPLLPHLAHAAAERAQLVLVQLERLSGLTGRSHHVAVDAERQSRDGCESRRGHLHVQSTSGPSTGIVSAETETLAPAVCDTSETS
jgi:hypothetical protein